MTDGRVRHTAIRLLLLVAVCAGGVLLLGGVASAATYTVTTTSDSSEACQPTLCSLRDAMVAVNASPGASGDTIVLPAGAYVLSAGQLPTITNAGVNLTLSGAGARTTTISGNGASRIFVFDAGKVAISGVTVTAAFNDDRAGTSLATSGGAIHNDGALSLTDAAVTNSVYEGAGGGGGIYTTGNLTLNRVTVSGNTASGDGGGIYVIAPGANPTISITDSTITANTVDANLVPGNSPTSEFGGGIEADQGTLLLSNTTVAGNKLNHGASGHGGGILLETSPGATALLDARNSIVAENSPTDCGYYPGGASSSATSTGPNLDSDSTCFVAASDRHANPLLQPLANSGGETKTLALSAASPAIDAGQSTGCPAIDQRGVARPQGAACDLGAYEAAAPIVQGVGSSNVSTSAATLTAAVNPDDQAAFTYFQYGTSTAYGSQTAGQFVGSDYASHPVNSGLTALSPGTSYHFRIVAASAIGTTYGADQTFATAPTPTSTPTPTPTDTLTVSVAGSGSGTVTGAGINCPGTCSHAYTQGATVELTATPAPGSRFAGWSGGGCSGTASCSVTVSSSATVTATFFSRIPPPKCSLQPVSTTVHISARQAGSRTSNAKPSAGTVVLTLNCDQAARVTLTGRLTELIGKHPKQRKTFRFGPVRASVNAGVPARLTIKLPHPALTGLRRPAKAHAVFTVTATNADGTETILTKATTLKPSS